MDERIAAIRKREEDYHLSCYDQHQLFEPGSWLHKPVKTVLELVQHIESCERPRVLDLGCGVGRNSIPIAGRIKERGGKVVCVDLLPQAIHKLIEYSERYEVSDVIEPVSADIGHFDIVPDTYDLIVAVSSIEHTASIVELDRLLERMAQGTRENGFICIIMSTNVKETVKETSESLEPSYELNLSTSFMLEKLKDVYNGWGERKVTVVPQKYEIERDGRSVLLQGDVLTYVTQKTAKE